MAEVTKTTTKEMTREELHYRATEPEYVKVYLKDILYLSDMPEGYTKIVYKLLQEAKWANEGMRITINSGVKRLMCRELCIKSPQTISNALSKLTKADILKRIETGVYALNPHLFGKGDWRDIEKLRLNVDYTLDGYKTFSAAIKYKGRRKANASGIETEN